YTALHNLFIPNDEEDCEDSSLGEVDKARAMKYVAVDLYNKDKPSEAIRLLKDLIALSDQVISQAAVKLLILSHLKAADIQTAIDLYVKMALDNPRLPKTLD
ncbi:hypothetical protein, partial [Pseudomonas viridiflava]|uniref:hypothetical protein n=1 Tax=Pseudomonas viridiflava TaxID=33069 RepID=UPI0013CE5051